MMRLIVIATTFVATIVGATAQEPRRSDLELLFLRTKDYVGKEIKLQGKLNNVQPEGAAIYLKADRLGDKMMNLEWKARSGIKWEEIQLACSFPAKDPRCAKVLITGTLSQTSVSDYFVLKDADYEFLK